jgi:hypothetical protein
VDDGGKYIAAHITVGHSPALNHVLGDINKEARATE